MSKVGQHTPVALDACADRCDDGAVRERVGGHGRWRTERCNALVMLDRVRSRHLITPKKLAAEVNSSSGEFLGEMESRGITPHSAASEEDHR